ncbi:MAG: PA domain-containing protein [Schumannella sp.]
MIGIRRRRAISAAAIATGAILAVGLSTPAYASPQLAGGESAASVTAGGPRGGWGHHRGGGGHHGGGHHGGGNGGGTVTSSDRLVQAVTAKGIIKHLKALQRIADRNDGNRSAGSEGHVESAEYIEAVLHRAGYQTERQPFSYDKTNLDRAEFSQVAPDPVDYVLQDQFYPMDYSGEGEVTAAAVPVDVNLEGDRSSSSGCEAEDFADFPAGAIALIQRGTCSFADKAANAEAAGPAGVVIFNQGNDVPGDDRFGVILGTLGDFGTGIPVLGTSFEIGETLVAATDAQLRIVVETTTVTVDTFNVIAKTAKGDPTKQVVVGLTWIPSPRARDQRQRFGLGGDPRGRGPAGQDQGEAADQIVFAWWSGEEDGLQGSNYYVSQLTEEQAANTGLNLNFDMVGSPNAVNFVYDGDGDAFGEAGPEVRLRSSTCSTSGSPRRVSRSSPRRSTGARTTSGSSAPASRRAGCSPGPRASSPTRRPRSSAAPRVRHTTRATTRRATPSRTSRRTPSRPTRMRWPTRFGPSASRRASPVADTATTAAGATGTTTGAGAMVTGTVTTATATGVARRFRAPAARPGPRDREGPAFSWWRGSLDGWTMNASTASRSVCATSASRVRPLTRCVVPRGPCAAVECRGRAPSRLATPPPPSRSRRTASST